MNDQQRLCNDFRFFTVRVPPILKTDPAAPGWHCLILGSDLVIAVCLAAPRRLSTSLYLLIAVFWSVGRVGRIAAGCGDP